MHIANAGALAEGDFAGVGFLLARKHGQEGGLPGSIGSDETNPVTLVDCEVYVLKQGVGAESFRDVLRIQDRRHFFSVRCPRFMDRGDSSLPPRGGTRHFSVLGTFCFGRSEFT
jgi:hypothetical protein